MYELREAGSILSYILISANRQRSEVYFDIREPTKIGRLSSGEGLASETNVLLRPLLPRVLMCRME